MISPAVFSVTSILVPSSSKTRDQPDAVGITTLMSANLMATDSLIIFIVVSGLHSEPTTHGEVAPVRIKKMKKTNKTVVATADNVPCSLRSGRPASAVPHL